MNYAPFPSLPDEINACYRLFTPRRLKKTNLRSISWESLSEWMQEARIYVGGDDEFRELLPRFFELSWQSAQQNGDFDSSPLYSLDCVNWLPLERETIQACFVLFWRLALAHENSSAMSEILDALRWGKFSWCPFLNIWLCSPVSTALLAPAIYLLQWDYLPPDARQWLCQKSMQERAQSDFFAATTPQAQEGISRFEAELAYFCSR